MYKRQFDLKDLISWSPHPPPAPFPSSFAPYSTFFFLPFLQRSPHKKRKNLLKQPSLSFILICSFCSLVFLAVFLSVDLSSLPDPTPSTAKEFYFNYDCVLFPSLFFCIIHCFPPTSSTFPFPRVSTSPIYSFFDP